MKICLFGISGIALGKHTIKDPRLDQADKLAEADKKTHAQVDVIGQDQLLDADAIVASPASKADLILRDLEFVETRLGRDPQPAERATLEKLKTLLENERFILNSGLSAEELQAVAAHSFCTNKPITVAAQEVDAQNPAGSVLTTDLPYPSVHSRCDAFSTLDRLEGDSKIASSVSIYSTARAAAGVRPSKERGRTCMRCAGPTANFRN